MLSKKKKGFLFEKKKRNWGSRQPTAAQRLAGRAGRAILKPKYKKTWAVMKSDWQPRPERTFLKPERKKKDCACHVKNELPKKLQNHKVGNIILI